MSIALFLACLTAAPVVLGGRIKVSNPQNKAEVSDSEPDSDEEAEPDSDEEESARSLLQEASNTSSAEQNDAFLGFEPKCPKLSQTANLIPNAVHIKIMSAHNLPYSRMDTVDPYVRFFVGPEGTYNGVMGVKDYETKWLGKTAYLNNNRDPAWNYGCTFFYAPSGDVEDENGMFRAIVMDKDSGSSDDFVAEIGQKHGQKSDGQKGVTMKEILTHDAEIDGEFDVTFGLYTKKGKKAMGRKQQSTIVMRFTVLRDPSKYSLKKATNAHSGTVGMIY